MILIDTDVLLDVALDRASWADPAARLLTLLERRPRMAFVAWHTLSNFYHLVAPARACGASYIATRNVRDFRRSPIPARMPEELGAELG